MQACAEGFLGNSEQALLNNKSEISRDIHHNHG